MLRRFAIASGGSCQYDVVALLPGSGTGIRALASMVRMCLGSWMGGVEVWLEGFKEWSIRGIGLFVLWEEYMH